MSDDAKCCPDCEGAIEGLVHDACPCHNTLKVEVEDQYSVGDYMGNKPAHE
jgi:hypothetical protein